jgi:hypothetical protein
VTMYESMIRRETPAESNSRTPLEPFVATRNQVDHG